MRSLRLDAVVTSPRRCGTSGAVRHHDQRLVQTRQPIHLHVDLARCPCVDPAGVDLLVELHRRLSVCGGRLTLLRPSARVRRLLQLSSADAVPE